MQVKMLNDIYHATTVCIDSCENYQIEGRLSNAFWQEAVPFRGLLQFFLLMEELLNSMNFPQPFTMSRSFGAPAKPPERVRTENLELRGDKATFVVRVLFRQNASWQGSILWVEEGREESFRSALELVFLMKSALDPGGAEKISKIV